MATAVETLSKRLQANPEDGEGWAMLGRSYRTMGRFDAAALAFGEAAKRLPSSAAVLTDWAEAVAQAQGRSLAGQPTELVNRALALDPAYPKALAMAGGAAIERGDTATALDLLAQAARRAARGQPGPGRRSTRSSPRSRTPRATRRRARPSRDGGPAPARGTRRQAGGDGGSHARAGGKVRGHARSRSGRRRQVGRRQGRDRSQAGARRFGPTDVVFIFARNPDAGRMPLAAIKLTAAELPKAFDLTDAMAMTPAATISGAAKVVIEARVSKSGDVVARPGDLSGVSAAVAPGARDVRVVIDKVVP